MSLTVGGLHFHICSFLVLRPPVHTEFLGCVHASSNPSHGLGDRIRKARRGVVGTAPRKKLREGEAA